MFGTAGSRRTVYLADDNPDVTLTTRPQSTPLKEAPTYLVYNRISTVIGEGACQSVADRPIAERDERPITERPESGIDARNGRSSVTGKSERPENSKESAIWYEYGCV